MSDQDDKAGPLNYALGYDRGNADAVALKRLVKEWRDAQREIDRTPVEERKNNLGPLHRLIAAHNALLKYANEEMGD
jgi:hypothetical protein